MLMYVCRTTMYLMYLTRKRFINLTRETFSTPSVIIVNHQSMIDIPFVLMFNPRVLVVTNDKWYNAKLIGIVIKLAGYLPATLGYDEIANRYRDYIRDGYSIIVFPEGSRSADQRIHRFHKGAFYMAEKLNLPILPMLIHGTGSYVAKGTLLGRRSLVTTRFLDRIMPGDASFGTGYKEKTLRIQNHFRAQFEELLKDYRDPRLQYDLMVRNFVYKGPVVEWYTRIKIRLENYYREYQALIPMNAKILDIGCGYGYLGIMLGRISSDRRITGIDYDEEKVLMAQHCASRPENVGFLHRDVLIYNFDSQDVIVMNDVMHYLPQDRQEDLLNRCIQCLNPGGMILLRDGDSQLHQRHKGTKLTEFFSTRSGFNKTTVQGLSFLSGEMVRRVAAEHGLSLATSDSTRFTSNVLFILRKPKTALTHSYDRYRTI